MALADDILEAVSDVLQEDVGQSVTLRRYTPGTRDADDPTAGTDPTVTNYTGVYVFCYDVEEKEVDGELINTGDKWAMIDLKDLAITPKPGDELIINLEVWKLAKPVKSGQVQGTNIYAIAHIVRV
jgi:hypothetical protein